MSILRRLFGPSGKADLEPPWDTLNGTGNGIGRAPSSLRAIAALDEEGFDALLDGELRDFFWHQGTIYLATPFAMREVLRGLLALPPARQRALLEWCDDCLLAEEFGEVGPSRAGVWLPAPDREKLARAGMKRPSIREVLREHASDLKSLADVGETESVREAARKLVAG